MRINPISEVLQIGDQLHIFTTSKRAALTCLDVLNSEIILDCVVNGQSALSALLRRSFGALHLDVDSQHHQSPQHHSGGARASSSERPVRRHVFPASRGPYGGERGAHRGDGRQQRASQRDDRAGPLADGDVAAPQLHRHPGERAYRCSGLVSLLASLLYFGLGISPAAPQRRFGRRLRGRSGDDAASATSARGFAGLAAREFARCSERCLKVVTTRCPKAAASRTFAGTPAGKECAFQPFQASRKAHSLRSSQRRLFRRLPFADSKRRLHALGNLRAESADQVASLLSLHSRSLGRTKRGFPSLARNSLTLSHLPHNFADTDVVHRPARVSVEVKSIVISVRVLSSRHSQGCPQNASNFFHQLLRHTVNNELPEVTLIAPCDPLPGMLVSSPPSQSGRSSRSSSTTSSTS